MLNGAEKAHSHDQCARILIETMAEKGAEVTVSTLPPLVFGPYTVEAFECPHGTMFYMEPTGEQIARWARDGVR